jgi:hypothetical protein
MNWPINSIFSAIGNFRWVVRQRGMPKGVDVLAGIRKM